MFSTNAPQIFTLQIHNFGKKRFQLHLHKFKNDMKQFILALSVSATSVLMAQDCSRIFISEYVEGTVNNKVIEIYNPTNAAVDLSEYQLHRWNNGTAIYDNSYTEQLKGVVPAKSVRVFVKDTAEGGVWNSIKAKADDYLTASCTPTSANRTLCFNGNDALTLEKLDKTVIDAFGYIGDDPGNPTAGGGWNNVPPTYAAADSNENSWTTNHTLIRKYNVKNGMAALYKGNGDPAWNVAVEWDSVALNTYDSLGFHRCECNELSAITTVAAAQFEISPNPAVDFVQVSCSDEIAEIKLTTFAGQTVVSRKLFQMNPVLNIKELQLAKGVYLLHVRTSKNSVATKVLQVYSQK